MQVVQIYVNVMKKTQQHFLLMGNICSRNCAFCGVTKGTPKSLDYSEINRIKKAISGLNISYVVLTTVTRDDLPDGGAYYLRDIINALNDEKHLVEALIPDLKGILLIGSNNLSKPSCFRT